MKGKILSCVLVASLLFSIGCYSTGTVTKEELKAKAEQIDITVVTKDLLKYEFSKRRYRVQGDTLIGLRVQVNPKTSIRDSVVASIDTFYYRRTKDDQLEWKKFEEKVGGQYRVQGDSLIGFRVKRKPNTGDSAVISIALADIASIETEELDGLATIALIFSPVVAYFLIGFIALMAGAGGRT